MDSLLLASVVDELDSLVVGARIEKIFLYDDHDLALRLRLRRGRTTLILSVDSEYPVVTLLDREPDEPRGRSPILEATRARLAGGTIRSVSKTPTDRTVVIEVGRAADTVPYRLVVELLPRSPAIYLVDPVGLVVAADGTGARRLRPTASYVDRPAPVHDDNPLAGLPKRAAEEVRARATRDSASLDESRRAFETACRDAPEPCLYRLQSGTLVATVTPYLSLAVAPESFPTALALTAAYYGRGTVARREEQRRARLLRALERRKSQLERAVAAVSVDAHGDERALEDRSAGELLLAYQAMAKLNGDTAVVTNAAADGGDLRIKLLDSQLSLVDNSQLYFARYRRQRRAGEASNKRLDTLALEVEHLDELSDAVQSASLAELPALEAELVAERLLDRGATRSDEPRRGKRSHTERLPSALEPRRFERADTVVLVGRSSRGNDHLTFEIAAPHDFWLHADAAGSHVILRNPDRRQTPEDDALLDAAALAAWYSRLREATKVEVRWTRRAHVARIPGAPPGRVRLKEYAAVRVDPRRILTRFANQNGIAA